MFKRIKLSKSKSKEKYLHIKRGEIVEEDKNYRKELHEDNRLNNMQQQNLHETKEMEEKKEFLKGHLPEDELSDVDKVKEMEKKSGLIYDDAKTDAQIKNSLNFNGNRLLKWLVYLALLVVLACGSYLTYQYAKDKIPEKKDSITFPFAWHPIKEVENATKVEMNQQDEGSALQKFLDGFRKKSADIKKTNENVNDKNVKDDNPNEAAETDFHLVGEIHDSLVTQFNKIADASTSYITYNSRRLNLASTLSEGKAVAIANRMKAALIKDPDLKEMLLTRLTNLESLSNDLEKESRLSIESSANAYLVDEEQNNQSTKSLLKEKLTEKNIPYKQTETTIEF